MFQTTVTMVFFSECAPFLLKIEKDVNIDDYKRKKVEIVQIHFKIHLNIFVSNVFLTLKIMNFENVSLTKLFIFVLFKAWVHYI
jgi:hypothetical protein